MVLIIVSKKADRCDIVFVPKIPLDALLEKHVDREGLAGREPKACIVDARHNWTGKPSHHHVIKLLTETLEKQAKLVGKDRRYPIPHHILQHNLLCRDFDEHGDPVGGTFEGVFKISIDKISWKKVAEGLRAYESIGKSELKDINDTFANLKGQCKEKLAYIVTHITPGSPRGIPKIRRDAGKASARIKW